jgi:hypothetical protein
MNRKPQTSSVFAKVFRGTMSHAIIPRLCTARRAEGGSVMSTLRTKIGKCAWWHRAMKAARHEETRAPVLCMRGHRECVLARHRWEGRLNVSVPWSG